MQKKWILIIAAITALFFILPIGGRPLMAPDESRYAEIAREMIAANDWVSPTLNGVRYFEKPPMGYWLWAGSMKLFGQNAFALRLPGMLATLGSALLVFFLALRYLDRRNALFAAAVYLTFPLVFVLGSVAILDPILTFFLTATTAFFFLAIDENCSRKKKWGLLFLSGVMCGCAFLTKGFLAFAVPAVCIVPYLLWEKRWKELLILPWLPLLGVIVISAPWAIAVHQAQPDYWRYFVFVEHIQRFFGQEKAQHSEPFFYFIPVLLLGMLQWVIMLPDLVLGLRKNIFSNKLLKYSFCCFLMPFLFFSLSSGKLATYILPCFAPLAILIAAGLSERFFIERKSMLSFKITAILFSTVLIIGAVGLSINQFTGWPVRLYSHEEFVKYIMIVLAAVLWAVFMFAALSKNTPPERKITLYIFGFLYVIVCSHFIFPDVVAERKAPSEYLATVPIPADATLITFRRPFQDVCWTYKRSDAYIFLSKGEIKYGLAYPDAEHRFIADLEGLQKLIRSEKAKGKEVYFVTRTDLLTEDFKDTFPPFEWKQSSGNGADDCYSVVKF